MTDYGTYFSIVGEEAFRAPSICFSVSASGQGYTMQISADCDFNANPTWTSYKEATPSGKTETVLVPAGTWCRFSGNTDILYLTKGAKKRII